MTSGVEQEISSHVELLAKEGESAIWAFDCFLLTGGAFTPQGKARPEQRKEKQ